MCFRYSVGAFQEKILEYIIGEFAFAKQARYVRFFFVFLFVSLFLLVVLNLICVSSLKVVLRTTLVVCSNLWRRRRSAGYRALWFSSSRSFYRCACIGSPCTGLCSSCSCCSCSCADGRCAAQAETLLQIQRREEVRSNWRRRRAPRWEKEGKSAKEGGCE